ncbi:LPP20 family lipoprotein [Candidatus Desantisbacteria bacterium]|nr:LPP20 family lipoprotein [Candidatus Desantisbacteria bacterium]
MTKKISFFVLIIFAGVFFTSCASAPSKPDWVMQGSGAFKKKKKKTFYGVGIAEGISSEALRRTTADNRAIAEISKQLSVMSTSLMRDYMSSATATEEEKSKGEQYVENTSKTFSSNMMSGVKIIDRWEGKNETMYSLAELNLDDLVNMSDKVNQLSQAVRDHIKANAEKAFDKLNEEEQKRK